MHISTGSLNGRRILMKLKELLSSVGVALQQNVYRYDHAQGMVPTGETKVTVSAHSASKKMILNHLEDEVPMYVRLGPIAIFAIQIPTPARYAFFSANSIGLSNYQVERYNGWNKDRFKSIKEKISGEATQAAFEDEKFTMWSVLDQIDGGESK